MRGYAAIISARLRVGLQYRAAALAGVGTQLFWGLIRMMIFEAFYRSTRAPQPMSLPEAITYVWLGQAMLGLLPWNVDADVRSLIRSGAVVYELTRPLDLYGLWYARILAQRVSTTALRALPLFCVAGLFFGLHAPSSVASALGWVAATIGAVLLGCALTNLMNISLLWTLSGEGVTRIVPSLVLVLSGMLIPLPLFPDRMQAALRALPFGDLVDVPFRIYMGNIPPNQIPGCLMHQLAWTFVLITLGRYVLAQGVRRLVVQGG